MTSIFIVQGFLKSSHTASTVIQSPADFDRMAISTPKAHFRTARRLRAASPIEFRTAQIIRGEWETRSPHITRNNMFYAISWDPNLGRTSVSWRESGSKKSRIQSGPWVCGLRFVPEAGHWLQIAPATRDLHSPEEAEVATSISGRLSRMFTDTDDLSP